ncbi:MAG: hypothetical protein KKA79_03065 [Nanoarchaeota archaeon]|nr:hypothetical protein [Nanoarchaeota archaeon]MCG2718906.1 hypothetical protein [Nanoarchaeota archaeon]
MEFNQIIQNYLKSTPSVKTLINWYDLYEGHYVRLDKNFQKRFFGKAIEKAGNYSELGRQLNIGRKTISSCSKGKTNPQIKTLKKIANYVSYPFEDINCKIRQIHRLRPNLPFNLNNKEGAEIRAAFLSDGHVDKNPVKPAQYCALEKELHKKLIELCKNIFGRFECKTYFNSRSHITKFPAAIGSALELGGVPRGNKMLSNIHVPKDIVLGNKEIQVYYLRRVFDDEGDVCFDKSGKRAVRISRSVSLKNIDFDIPPERWVGGIKIPGYIKHNLILGEQILLINLGIDAKVYSEGVYKNKKGKITAKWRIQIGQQDSIRKFAESINFSLKRKREKLDKILESYQYRKLPNGQGKKEALDFIKKVLKKKGFLKFSNLGMELMKSGRSYDLAGYYLKFFIDQKIIKKTQRGVYTYDKS